MTNDEKNDSGEGKFSDATCNFCSTPLPNTANYCPQCGLKQNSDSSEVLHNNLKASDQAADADLFTATNMPNGQAGFANVVGEHKHATLMFADIRGSLNLIQDYDPEKIETEIDKLLNTMIKSVELFDGSVVQVQGDGILAIFGAPLAQEDHAARACNAALMMLSEFNALKASEGDKAPQIGIGIQSGRIVISTIKTTVGVEYRVLGNTTWSASRLEKLAGPGVAIVSESTHKLTEGLFDYQRLEPVTIKGHAEKAQVYELAGRTTLTRFKALVARGLSPLVGREQVLEDLLAAARRSNGEHQTVTLIIRGDPGVGKSRLAYELLERLKHEYTIAEAHGITHSRSPFSVFSRMLRLHLKIAQKDSKTAIEKKLKAYIQRHPSLFHCRNALANMLDLTPSDTWKKLEPGKRQIQQFTAVRKFLDILSNKTPLLLLAEDLQWFDDESKACLQDIQAKGLLDRLLIVGTSRIPKDQDAILAEYGSVFEIQNLSTTFARQLIHSLVGTSPLLQDLVDKLIEKTGCNPFYIEEMVRLLLDTEVIEGNDGNYTLTNNNAPIEIPARVESIVASRIDRLPKMLRKIITIAAAINNEIDVRIIARVLNIESTIDEHLKQLVEMDILFLELEVPLKIYQFRHALIFEILLKNLHSNRRKAIHVSVFKAIEAIYSDRLLEKAEQLARHARRGECWSQAVMYYKMDCAKSIRQYANEHAEIALERALECLEHTPESEEKVATGIALRLMGLSAILPLGDHHKIQQWLLEARELAESIEDNDSLGTIDSQLATQMWIASEQNKAMDYAKKAFAISVINNSIPLKLSAWHGMGTFYYSVGDFEDAEEIYAKALALLLEGKYAKSRLGWVGYPSVICRTFLGASLTLMGKYKEAEETFEVGRKIADEVDDPYSRAILREEYSICLLETGRIEEALDMLELAVQICEQNQVANVYPSVCARLVRTLAVAGRAEEAIALVEDAQKQKSRLIGGNYVNSLMMTAYSYALMCAGRHNQAITCISTTSDYVESKGEYPNLGIAQALLGEIYFDLGEPGDLAKAEQAFLKGLEVADRITLLPTKARCFEGLGKLYVAKEEFVTAGTWLRKAADLYTHLNLEFKNDEVESILRNAKGSGAKGDGSQEGSEPATTS